MKNAAEEKSAGTLTSVARKACPPRRRAKRDAETTADVAPDGFTLLASTFNTAVMPLVLKGATFDPETDLAAMGRTDEALAELRRGEALATSAEESSSSILEVSATNQEVAENIANHGTLAAPAGSIGLASGKEVLLSQRPDGRGLSTSVTLPSGSIQNSGQIAADAGTIALHARVVNQSGSIQANSVREHNGVIELLASDSIRLASSSSISTRGDASVPSNGGQVVVKADRSFADASGSRIDIRGGASGGNGGDRKSVV